MGPEPLVRALERRDVRQAIGKLRDWHVQGACIAAACGGTFLMAEAGLLEGRAATTTWSLAPAFRQRYPQVALDETRMIVPAGRVVTAGAAFAHVDLALWLLRRHSPELASAVAHFLLIDHRESQAAFIAPSFLAHNDPLLERFEHWARANMANCFSLQAAAHALSVGPRTLQRRTEAALGCSPLAYFQDLRVERARHLVALGHPLAKIAPEVGYADPATLRALLRNRLGRGIRELRAMTS
jgi:transcriptional regulator GlxA family with amidase domain